VGGWGGSRGGPLGGSGGLLPSRGLLDAIALLLPAQCGEVGADAQLSAHVMGQLARHPVRVLGALHGADIGGGGSGSGGAVAVAAAAVPSGGCHHQSATTAASTEWGGPF